MATRELTDAESCDLFLLAVGALAPLETYMTAAQYRACLSTMCLPDGAPMPLPVTLFMPDNVAVGDTITLTAENDIVDVFATLRVTEAYAPDADEPRLLGGEAPHPYAARFHADGVYVTGDLHVERCALQPALAQYYMTPEDVAVARGTGALVAFQTRNPLHASHLALIRATAAGRPVMLHPTVGPTQDGDVPVRFRLASYCSNRDEFPFAVVPLAMRMLGPREALWHAVIRQNYGFSHFVVGRDHAGPSVRRANGTPWFAEDAAPTLCRAMAGTLTIEILTIDPAGLNLKPVSGTAVRLALRAGTALAPDVVPPRTAAILARVPELMPAWRRGLCIQFTGLPASGKSTLAVALKRYLDTCDAYRTCQILDGDALRAHFRDLGFDRAARSTQTRRVGYLASLIVRAGGVALCANIAPYADDRAANRALLGDAYCEVYVATPLDECERRDPKGLYRRARAGALPNFTGVDDSYEAPSRIDDVLTVETTGRAPRDVACALIVQLERRGLI